MFGAFICSTLDDNFGPRDFPPTFRVDASVEIDIEHIMLPFRPKTSLSTQALAASLPLKSTTVQGSVCSSDSSVYKQALVLDRLDLDPTDNPVESRLTECAFASGTSGSTTASSSHGDSSGPITPLSTSPTSSISCPSLGFTFEEDGEGSHYPEETLGAFKAKFHLPRRLQCPPCLTTTRSLAMEASQPERNPPLTGSHKPVGTAS